MTPLDIGGLRREFPDRRIDYYPSIDSTMRVAAALEPGAVVLAEEQRAGLGRHGHTWHSEAGSGIYCSLVLAPAPVLTLALGLAAQDAIAKSTGIACDLRWPNDVMIGGRKCAGILAQLDSGAIVAGIGINVNHAEFPEEIASLATSLRLAGAIVAREDLLIALLRAIDDACEMLIAQGPPVILEAFSRASSYASGRRVRFEHDGATMEGITRGLDSAGFLLVRDDNGKDTTIFAGGVRPI